MIYDLGGRVAQALKFRPIRRNVRSEGAVADANPALYR
jgi:hypothetical protein